MDPAVIDVKKGSHNATAPTLALAVPAYNQGPYLREMLASALAQSVPFDEIVVSNNRSTDATATVLSEYRDRVTITGPSSHLSMAAHWNFVVSQVQSDWVALVSSDDVLRPNFSQVIRRAAQRDLAAVHVRAAWDVVDQRGQILRRHYLMSLRRVTRPPRTLLEQLHGPKGGLHASAFKVAAWRAAGGFPEDCEFAPDWGLWIRLAPFGSFVYEPTVVSCYRIGHQDQLEAQRMLPYLRDNARFATRLIPEAAEALGLDPNHQAIRRAAEQRLLRMVRAIATQTLPVSTDAATPVLEDWASSVNRTYLLDALRENTRLPNPPMIERLRSSLSGATRSTYTRWRR